MTGDIIRGEKISDKVVGYVAYLELINGFSKSLYMTVEELKAHAEKFSISYAYDLRNGKRSSVWSTNFAAMAKKTVLKRLLNTYGIISIDLQSAALATALQSDQAAITEEGFRYIDNEQGDAEKIVPLMLKVVEVSTPLKIILPPPLIESVKVSFLNVAFLKVPMSPRLSRIEMSSPL